MSVQRWVFADEGNEDNAPDSDDEIDLEEDDDTAREAQHAAVDILGGSDFTLDAAAPNDDAGPSTSGRKPGKISIKLSGTQSDVCHVCGAKGHFAGFVGSIYLDCKNKPCYLCGKHGHSTRACRHRFAPELNCAAASDVARGSILQELQRRESSGAAHRQATFPPRPGTWNVDAAVLKLHSRRTTCLEFHPHLDNIVLSGDKKGQIAVWDVAKVFERTVYPDVNRWLTNAIKFLPDTGGSDNLCATASYDGTVKLFDVETGIAVRTLVDANPCGWERVVEADKAGTWVTFIALDIMPAIGAVVAGDSKGSVYFLDPRISDAPTTILQAHKKNTKVQSACVHPVDGCLVLTAGNDYHARLLDARCLGSGQAAAAVEGKGKGPAASGVAAEIGSLVHPRVINAACFSPISGRKIMTTCQDNRLRIWDDWTDSLGATADREIVHSHTFNRHLTPFKAEFDPKDPTERLAVIGRYISEDYGGIALHPIDLIDTATGANVGELRDPNLTTICPVNKPHPRVDLIVTGSSRSLYAWRPAPEDEEEGEEGEGVAVGAGGGGAGTSGAAGFQNRDGQDGGSGGGNGGKPSAAPRGSAHYLFFDADGSGGNKKKRAKQGEAGTKAKTKAKTTTAAGNSSKDKLGDAGDSDSD